MNRKVPMGEFPPRKPFVGELFANIHLLTLFCIHASFYLILPFLGWAWLVSSCLVWSCLVFSCVSFFILCRIRNCVRNCVIKCFCQSKYVSFGNSAFETIRMKKWKMLLFNVIKTLCDGVWMVFQGNMITLDVKNGVPPISQRKACQLFFQTRGSSDIDRSQALWGTAYSINNAHFNEF